MAAKKKTAKKSPKASAKKSVKVKDLSPRKNPKGGRKESNPNL